MNFIANTKIVQQACTHFVQSHPCHYNFTNQIAPFIKIYPHLSPAIEEITTQHQIADQKHTNTIKLNLVLNSNNSQNCIVYLHGLASYCMEGKFLVPLLADSLNLCLYDSRGHGKSKSKYVTYGLLQSQELAQVVKYLVSRGFKNIILWGRSMGAVACLKLLQILCLNSLINNIKYVVADAPFVSYKQIATEIVSKSTHLPEFISGILSDAFAQKIKTNYGLDLKEIDLSELQTIVPVNFLYSSNDELMGVKHVERIVKNNRGDYETNDIKVMHNDERPTWIITKMITIIREKLKNRHPPSFLQSKRKGLSITKYCQDALSFPETPKILTSRAIRDNIKNQNKIQANRRQIQSQLYGAQKQNHGLLRNKFKGYSQLGLSKINIVSNKITCPKKQTAKRDRKITVSQFFLSEV